MIELDKNMLNVSFPEVHPRARCSIEFQRTLRVPDDNRDYPLPAGLGSFPLFPVDDFQVPTSWKKHGGVFMPMYQSEAMWIRFAAQGDYPFAVKIAAGKINAVNGEQWRDALSSGPQDYCVIPEQPWLDGFSVSRDVVRQFVAMPLGEGVTAEGQLTGKEEWGGIQLILYPMKADEYERRFGQKVRVAFRGMMSDSVDMMACCYEMGIAPGGRIRQEIAEDPFGLDVWDTSASSRCYVHLLNSDAFRAVTGKAPPAKPTTSKEYEAAGIPWFDYYLDKPALPGSSTLAKLDGLVAAVLKKGGTPPENKPVVIAKTVRIPSATSKPVVREGDF